MSIDGVKKTATFNKLLRAEAERDALAAKLEDAVKVLQIFAGYSHGEDCPADEYDLEEGQEAGECECGVGIAGSCLARLNATQDTSGGGGE